MVPFGDFHISFRPNSFPAASSGVMSGAFDADADLLDSVRGINRDLVVCLVAVIHPEIEIHQVDVKGTG